MSLFRIKEYTIQTTKIMTQVRFAIVSDLHGCPYGEKQRELLSAIEAEAPAAVLMTGDMNDDRDEAQAFWDFIYGAVKLAPCFYVTGNHEYGRRSCSISEKSQKNVEEQKRELRSVGIQVLDGGKIMLPGTDGSVAVMGIDDKFAGELEWNVQYLECCRMTDASQYTILLSHRPELAGFYRYFPGDLVICGHAHGGQWRLPGAGGGLYAPGQGLFPKRAGGLYEREKGHLLVSCGLCYRYPSLPRFGNPPELVILTLQPGGRK